MIDSPRSQARPKMDAKRPERRMRGGEAQTSRPEAVSSPSHVLSPNVPSRGRLVPVPRRPGRRPGRLGEEGRHCEFLPPARSSGSQAMGSCFGRPARDSVERK